MAVRNKRNAPGSFESKPVQSGKARVVRQRKPRNHKTRQKLLEAAQSLLRKNERSDITSAMVLEYSGISRGSLYYHFADFSELMGEAEIGRYAKLAEQEIVKIERAASQTSDGASFVEQIVAIIGQVQSDTQRTRRLDQACLIAQSKTNSHFASLLAREQSRITNRLISALIKAQSKGVISTSNDPLTIAVLIQACSFGRIIDDIAGMRLRPVDWDNLIKKILI